MIGNDNKVVQNPRRLTRQNNRPPRPLGCPRIPLRTPVAKESDGAYRPIPGLPGIEGAEGGTTGSGSVVRFRDGSRYEFTVFGRGNQVLTAQPA